MTNTARRVCRALARLGVDLLIVFVPLKFAGVITWPWWLVLAPLWPVVVIVGLALVSAGATR